MYPNLILVRKRPRHLRGCLLLRLSYPYVRIILTIDKGVAMVVLDKKDYIQTAGIF